MDNTTDKHPDEMPDEILYSLGFVKKKDEAFFEGELWGHTRGNGQCYFHSLTPQDVMDALIEIGKCEFRRAAVNAILNIE